ncbi:MAG: general secretion pathway protein GspK [Methylocystis sp.]|nr:general secretion pathway protein GspK [Methylocystis sp.]
MTRRAAKPRPRRRADGFALILVIWGLGVISLLVVSFMTTGRLRLQAANNVAAGAQAIAAVDGVANLVIMRLLAERGSAQALTGAGGVNRPVYDGAPYFCAFGDAAMAVSVEDESGKIDLNAAAPEMLKAALLGLGEDARRAEALTAAIVAFRTQREALEHWSSRGPGEKPFAPKYAPFQTVLELDQVEGVDPQLFKLLTPITTVHSRNTGVNPLAAPPALFAALLGYKRGDVERLILSPFPNALTRNDPNFPTQFKNAGGLGDVVTIRVEAMLPGGQASARETIVDFNVGLSAGFGAPAAPYLTREIRRSASRYRDALRAALNAGGLRPC